MKFDLTVGNWQTLQATAQVVRTEVFVHEQGIAPKDEWDADDPTATHAVIYLSNDKVTPVATARLLQPDPHIAKIGRMAVTRSLRGYGLGRQLVQALLRVAKERGDHEVRLSAQISAEGFYTQLGFVRHGETYDEVGIAHVEMRLKI